MLKPSHLGDSTPSEQANIGLIYPEVVHLGCLMQQDIFMLVLDKTNQNITAPQKELLLWHQKLCHFNQQRVQMMLSRQTNSSRCQIITPKFQGSSSCACPLCAACQLSKQTRLTPTCLVPCPPQMDIQAGDLQPGDCVSIYQYKSRVPGWLPNTKGKEPKKDKYNGGSIFVDHALGLIYIYNQVSLNVGKTLCGKQAFEQCALSCGV